MNTDPQARIALLKSELFIRAIEYARLKLFNAYLENGCWVHLCSLDAETYVKMKLDELAEYSIRIVKELSVIPGERSAMTEAEQEEEYKKAEAARKTTVDLQTFHLHVDGTKPDAEFEKRDE